MHIASCEFFWEYEGNVHKEECEGNFCASHLKTNLTKNEMESFQGDKLWDPFLASRDHFLSLLRFSWSAYTSFCGLGQIMCQKFDKFCCHTSFIAIHSSLQSWRSWEQSYLYKFLAVLPRVSFSPDHHYFLHYFSQDLRYH